jgi:hypothetical protein
VDLGPKGNPEHFLLLLVIIIIIHSLMMFAFFRLNFENEVIAVGSDDAKWEAERVGGGLEGDVVAPRSGFGHVAEVRVVVCELGGGIVLVVVASYRDNFVLEIQPEKRKHHQRVNNNNNNEEEEKVLWISFWSEVHYNSLYPIDSSKFST